MKSNTVRSNVRFPKANIAASPPLGGGCVGWAVGYGSAKATEKDVGGWEWNVASLSHFLGRGIRVVSHVLAKSGRRSWPRFPSLRLSAFSRPGVGTERFLASVARPAGRDEIVQLGRTAVCDGDDVIDFETDVGGELTAIAARKVVSAQHCPANTEPLLHRWSCCHVVSIT
jgi:hypothetical protein